MNKIYKVVWSKVKNCYVVTSELAKNHSKLPKSNVFNKTLVAGVLSCVFSCGFVNLGYAYTVIGSGTAGIQLDEFHSNIVSTTLNENARKAINVVSHNGQVLVLNDSYYGGTLSNDAKAVQVALKDLIVSGTGVAPKDLTDPYFVVEAVLDDALQASYLVHYIGTDDSTQYIKLTTAEAENIGLRKFLSSNWVTENGNYITKDKDLVQNLQVLDTKTADLDTIVAGHTTDITNLKDLSNITDTGKSVVRDLAQTSVKVVNGTNTTVTEGTDGTYKTYAVNMASNGTVASGNTGLVTGGTVFNALQSGNGTYISSDKTLSQNLTALDTAVNNNKIHFFSANGSSSTNNYNNNGASGDAAIAIGANAVSQGMNAIAIGPDSVSYGGYGYQASIALGKHAQTQYGGIAIGLDTYGQAGGIVIGERAKTTWDSGTTYTNNTMAIVIGYEANSHTSDKDYVSGKFAESQIAIGSDATVEHNGIAFGRHAYAEDGFAIGDRSNAYNLGIALGYGAETSNKDGEYSGISIGTDSLTYGGASMGKYSLSGIDSIAIGVDSRTGNRISRNGYYNRNSTYYSNSVAVGSHSWADASNAVAIGSKSYASTTSTAIGRQSSAKNNSVAVGADSIAIGSNVVSFGHTTSDYVPFVPTDYVGSSTEKYSSNLTRRLINVSRGTSATDAATVAQTLNLIAGNNVSLSSDGNSSIGQPIRTISVNTTGVVEADNTGIVTGDTVYKAIRGLNLSNSDTVTIRDLYTPPVVQSIANIVNSQSTPSDKTTALGNALTTYGNILHSDPLEAIGVTSSEMNDFMGTIYNGVMYGSMTQERYDEIMQKNLTLSESYLSSRQINVNKNGTVTEGNTGIVTGGTVYDAIQNALQDVGGVDVTNKANINADNISDAQAWADKLGLGTINAEDTKLVTGSVVAGETRVSANGNYVQTSKTAGENISLLDTGLKDLNDIAVKYDNNNRTVATLGGNNGTKLTNLKPATLSATSADAVTGAQLYATNQNIAGFSADITRNKNNIRDLNTSVSSALSSVSSTSSLVTTLDNTKADVSLNNLSSAGRQMISNVAINAVQEYMTAQQGNNNPATPTAPMMYSGNTNTLNVTNAGNGSLYVGEGSNVNGSQSIAIGVGNQVNANNAGAFGDPSIINADASYVLGNDDTVNTGAVASFIVGNDSVSSAKGGLLFGSNSEATNIAENSMGLGNNTTVSAKNSVALGSNSIADEENVISIGNTNLQRRITNVANGNIAENSTDAVTGGQLFTINQTVSQHSDLITKNASDILNNANEIENNKLAIATKADIDASNINVDAWSQKLGVGQIEEGNAGLVTGGTVYDSVKTLLGNNPIQATDEAIFIGANRSGNTISIYNKDGENRIITGVATNPEDLTSATNVGYVNTIASNILENVNGRFAETDKRMNKVGANAVALASLTPASFEGDEKWSLAASVGHYKGETAGAVGAFYKPTENVMMNVRGAVGNGENMLGAGVAVSLTKGDIPGVTKRQLADTVNKQADEITVLKQNQQAMLQNQQVMLQQIEELTRRLEIAENKK